MFKSSKKKLIVSGCSYSDNYATREGIANFKVYATITNLLNTQHIINVYNRTGDAYDDGFLNDPALSSLIIEGRGPEYVEMYRKINLANRNHWLNDHSFDMFGIPREVRMGVSVSF